jgi:nanoRNase/pAp phosphatase (c-di-AMP/oligoRNAs hydrolase)
LTAEINVGRTEKADLHSLTRVQHKADKLEAFLASRPSDSKAAIIMQPNPDPDALGAALGLQWLLEVRYGIPADLFSSGVVSHPQNQTAINVLDIRIKGKDAFSRDLYETVIVVDTVPQNTAFSDVVPKFHVVIDHHQFDVDAEVSDIRPVGACSTLVWEYLRHFEMDYDTERGLQVSTALLFGIRNDTSGLLSENTGPLDIEAHADLMRWIDRKKLQDIIQYSFPSYLYDLRSVAVDNKVVRDSVLISGLGILTSKKRDALPVIADEFIRMEGIETVVVFAMVGEYVEASVRSRNSSLNVHDFCQRIFGPDFAGGKHGSGGARVPMGFLYSPSDDEELRNEICKSAQKIITQRILNHLL